MRQKQVEIRTSKRFIDHYVGLAPHLRTLTNLAIEDLRRRYAGEVPLESRRIRIVKGVSPQVWRMKLDRAPRMLFRWDGDLTLLEVGDHEVTDRYSSQQLARDLGSAAPLPDWIRNGVDGALTFFARIPDQQVELLDACEVRPEWIYYLDAEQQELTARLLDKAWTAKTLRDAAIHFVTGGPGTGKTCILLTLLDLLRQDRSLEVRFKASDAVARYVQSGVDFDLEPHRYAPRDLGGATPRVLLVDDPGALTEIVNVCESATLARRQLVVFAFDPLQLADSVSDTDYEELCRRYRVTTHTLATCYRQKANVGRAAKRAMDAIAASTPFLDDGKIKAFRRDHAGLTRQSNELSFANPSGYVQTYVDATLADLEREIDRICDVSGNLWSHWPALLLACDPYVPKPFYEAVIAVLERRRSGTAGALRYDVAPLSEVERIKGVEYQHVFLLLGEALYTEVERGFRGSGKRTYNGRRLLRIPFSRAKDSLVTFVVGRSAEAPTSGRHGSDNRVRQPHQGRARR